MKKRLALILALTMMATTMLAGCGSKSSDDADSKEEAAESVELKEGDTFTVGFDAEFPPYGFKDDNGEYTGFDLDCAQEVCDRNGWKLEKKAISWDAKDMELDSGTIDCIWNGFTIQGREDDYTWSEPYVDNSQVFLVKADSDIKSQDDLAGKTVLVQADSSALDALQGDAKDLADTFGALTEVPDYNTAAMNLEAGAADAVALDKAISANYTADGKLKVLDEEGFSQEQYAIGFKLGNEALRDQVQKTFDEMVADGTVEKIAEKYAEYDVASGLCVGADK